MGQRSGTWGFIQPSCLAILFLGMESALNQAQRLEPYILETGSCSEHWSDSFRHPRILIPHITTGAWRQAAGTPCLGRVVIERETMRISSCQSWSDVGTKPGPRQMVLGPQNRAVEKGLIYQTILFASIILVSIISHTSEARKISIGNQGTLWHFLNCCFRYPQIILMCPNSIYLKEDRKTLWDNLVD